MTNSNDKTLESICDALLSKSVRSTNENNEKEEKEEEEKNKSRFIKIN